MLKALFATKDRSSVLGTYSIDENGDTSLTDYGVYNVDGGELMFDKTVKAAGRLDRDLSDGTAGGGKSRPGRRAVLTKLRDAWKPPPVPARPAVQGDRLRGVRRRRTA